MTRQFPSTSQVRQLGSQGSMKVPPEWEDWNGHVNVQHYQELYSIGYGTLLEDLGVSDKQMQENDWGMFDLEHHIHYLAEIHVGDEVSVYNRFLGLSQKRFHGMVFLVNDSHEQLACTLEYVTLHIDLAVRRGSPMDGTILSRLNELLAGHQTLNWSAPVCGVMSA